MPLCGGETSPSLPCKVRLDAHSQSTTRKEEREMDIKKFSKHLSTNTLLSFGRRLWSADFVPGSTKNRPSHSRNKGIIFKG
jgi:hypothetical protein